MTLSPAFLDELRSRTSLSHLIERKVKLTKAGVEKKGCCPFHGEKTPSFYVNDGKGFYHCFGCSAHGDAIRWMTEHEGLQFMDAVKVLAEAAGMEMPAQDPRHNERDRERGEMLEIMERAAAFYAANLTDPVASGTPPGAYLKTRGIDADQIHDFGIGWAAGGRNAEPLHRHLKDVAPAKLVTLGLAKIHEDGERAGEVYDFFRARIMFPIRDQRGRVIGFGGRALGDQQPKYLNSPDTPVFDKGRTLYNLHRAGPAAKAAKRLIVVEGYMDVIGLSSASVDEVVAPNGTAITEAQISGLWRLSDTPILCFDGDKAGKTAAARAALRALPLLEPDRSLSFVTPPDGQDPDDVARGGGRGAVEGMLAKLKPLVDVIWEHEAAAAPVETPEQRAGFAKRLREDAALIRNAAVRQAYFDEFKARYEAVPKTVYTAGPRRAPLQKPSTERQPFSRREKPSTEEMKEIARTGMHLNIERAVLDGLLRYPELAVEEMELVVCARFSSRGALELRDYVLDSAGTGGEFVVPEHLQETARFAGNGPLRFSFNKKDADPAIAKADLADALYQLRR